jgi:hypothetical protein
MINTIVQATYMVGGWTKVHNTSEGHLIVSMTLTRKGHGWDTYRAECECGATSTRVTYGISSGTGR